MFVYIESKAQDITNAFLYDDNMTMLCQVCEYLPQFSLVLVNTRVDSKTNKIAKPSHSPCKCRISY